MQTFLQSPFRMVRSDRDTNLLRPNCRRVTLTLFAPVDLHVIGPGRNTEMLPVRVAKASSGVILQPCPLSNARVRPVSSDDPARAHKLFAEANSVVFDSCDGGPPQ